MRLPHPSGAGLYVGAAAGYAVGASEFIDGEGVNFLDVNLNGAQGVASIGYDFHLSPKWVLGAFADYAFGEVDGTVGGVDGVNVTIDRQWAVGGRLGVLATPSTLLFASAGYTAADLIGTESVDTFVSARLDGYFVGLGFEQAFSRNLSLKLDYRFSDYGDARGDSDIDNDVHSIRLGVNYRFGR